MAVLIGQASKDENRKYRNGSAGDQTGVEVYTCNWYSNNWKYLIRPKSSAVAEKMAATMAAACANNNIGYDQNERNTILAYAKKANFDMSKITTKCECDCTSLVSVCVIAAGGSESVMYSGGNLAYTGNLVSRCKSTGLFDVYTDSKYLSSSSYLKRGDILMSSGHAVIVLGSGSSASSSTSSSTSSSSSYDTTPDDIREIQTYMNKVYGSGLTVDGIYGKNTKKAIVIQVQKLIGTSADGIFGSNSKSAWGSRCIKNGSKGDLVRLVQMMLVCRGYSVGSAGCDADCGSGTVSGIKSFQKKNGLSVDGIAGKNTAYKLFA